jgi:uncharacterized membrane protein
MMKTILLIAHLIAIAMGTGMSISNYVNLRVAKGVLGEGRKALAQLRGVIARIADIVIAVIWLTGIGLWWALPQAPNSWFLIKIAFVVLLTVSHGLVRLTAARIKRTGDQSLMPRLEIFVSGVWLSALAAIILAVLAFET